MPEETHVRVLLCGDHLDGQWVDVPPGVHWYRHPKPKPQWFLGLIPEPDAGLGVPLPEVAEYRLEPLPIKIRSAGGGPLWVGACGYGPERDEAILRALLQRDVAQQLLGGNR